jgi:hypothetical protein
LLLVVERAFNGDSVIASVCGTDLGRSEALSLPGHSNNPGVEPESDRLGGEIPFHQRVSLFREYLGKNF